MVSVRGTRRDAIFVRRTACLLGYQKPFALGDLATKVRETLDAA
jgi:hypothetical protein